MPSDAADRSKRSGVSFAGLLFLVFLTLKLCKVIDWSWWWVTAPLWGPLAAAVLVMLVIGGLAGVVILFAKIGERFNAR